jgi:hypothetical protein
VSGDRQKGGCGWSVADLKQRQRRIGLLTWVRIKPQFGDAFLMRARFNELSGQSVRESIPAKPYGQLYSTAVLGFLIRRTAVLDPHSSADAFGSSINTVGHNKQYLSRVSCIRKFFTKLTDPQQHFHLSSYPPAYQSSPLPARSQQESP